LDRVHVLLVDRGHDGADLLLCIDRCLPKEVVDQSKRRRDTGLNIIAVLNATGAAKLDVFLGC
jgi:hypothetical protein